MNKRFIFQLFSVVLIISVTAAAVLANVNQALLLMGLAAFGLGLRHGIDADHIVAIDNVTRKLLSEQKNSLTTGLYFALGHSTVVFLLTVILVLGLYQIQDAGNVLRNYGSVIGAGVSATFLLLTALMNIPVLRELIRNKELSTAAPVGVMAYFGRRLFNINHSRGMYIVGFCFGLGFDTATEVALLGTAAVAVLQGTQIWAVLLLPVLFAGGMIMTDSLDCVFMASVFGWAAERKARLRKYNIIIIGCATASATILGLLSLAGLLAELLDWQNVLAQVASWLGDHSEAVGLGIMGLFAGIWLVGKIKGIAATPVTQSEE